MSDDLERPKYVPEPLSDEERKLLATTAEELKRSVQIYCFDLEKYKLRTKTGEKWQQLLQSHLYYDHVISTFLNDNLANPEAIHAFQMGFSQKLNLVEALGLLKQEAVSAIRYVNKLRNKIAHDLEFVITDKEVTDFYNCLPPDLYDLENVKTAKASGNNLFWAMLSSLLLYAEFICQTHSFRRLNAKRIDAIIREVTAVRLKGE